MPTEAASAVACDARNVAGRAPKGEGKAKEKSVRLCVPQGETRRNSQRLDKKQRGGREETLDTIAGVRLCIAREIREREGEGERRRRDKGVLHRKWKIFKSLFIVSLPLSLRFFSLSLSLSHTHTHTYTRTHTRIHTLMHTHSQSHSHLSTLTLTLALSYI